MADQPVPLSPEQRQVLIDTMNDLTVISGNAKLILRRLEKAGVVTDEQFNRYVDAICAASNRIAHRL